MKNVFLGSVFAIALVFSACDSGSSGAGPEPVAEVSSSSTTRHCEEQTEGCDEAISSSSVTDKGTSSGGGSVSSSSTNSSSSAKTSSSTDAKSSSSSSLVLFESSSSLSKQLQCLAECTEDCEGETYWHKDGFQMICRSGQWLNLDSLEQANEPSSSSYFDMTEQFNEKVSYGEFTDPRDGHKYRTVSVSDGKFFTDTLIFFAENLNFGKMVPGGTVLGDSAKYCYDDDPWYCDNGWGGLYTWSAAMNIPSICDSVELGLEKCPYEFQRDNDGVMIDGDVIHQGICPEGWHIVHDGEWAYLQQKSGSSASYLGSKVAGFGSNGSGLSILPTGSWERYPNGSLVFRDIRKQAIFWTAQQSEGNAEKAFLVTLGSQGIDRLYKDSKSNRALSIRCVKNY
ncbi:hypothetical protein IKQ19_06195 [Candidatus Saccharibacteria bacterium]|nr:hypothetical protein [Candidatus Saccharibacteria bacterium]